MNRAARDTVYSRGASSQAAPRVPLGTDEDALVVLGFLRDAMAETGWTQEALSAWFKEHDIRSSDRQYVGKMLSGEKPITLRDVVALPDDLEGAFVRRWNAKFGPSEQVVLGNVIVALGEALRVCQFRSFPSKAGPPAKSGLSHPQSSALPRVVGGE